MPIFRQQSYFTPHCIGFFLGRIYFEEAQRYSHSDSFHNRILSSGLTCSCAIMANADVYPGFENFDDSSVYKSYEAAISDNETLNMVVEFDSAGASSALNIDNPAMSLVLGAKVNLSPKKKIIIR